MTSLNYWRAKIWGLLHNPVFKPLYPELQSSGENSFWQTLAIMAEWKDSQWNPDTSQEAILQHIKLADNITAASDRGAIGSVTNSIEYQENGLEITHLLSGRTATPLRFQLSDAQHQEVINQRDQTLTDCEQRLRNAVPNEIKNDPKPLFWWLWRCLPEVACQVLNNPNSILIPAETQFPDSSIWSHASLTAAFAGALAGYDLTSEAIAQTTTDDELSHPYLASFTFSPVQELIKASRKMRDFWAGSWLLHYLSAKVCWKLAKQYGPDCFLYPSLFQQPLIDHWLRQEYPDIMSKWVKQPGDRALLTAGFPNVLMLILPKAKVAAAMQTAKNELLDAWKEISHLTYTELHDNRHWQKQLQETDHTWRGWLDTQWQTYWSAVPIGKEGEPLKSPDLPNADTATLQNWIDQQNKAYNLKNQENRLFKLKEQEFLNKAAQNQITSQNNPFNLNVGSWWAPIFSQTRFALAAVKNARNWRLPTAFGPRSTISGLGPVVYPDNRKQKGDWVSEGETRQAWQREAGLFDGIEELNATETVKRILEKILPQLLNLEDSEAVQRDIAASYPDLTAGVAGYLKVNQDNPEVRTRFNQVCEAIIKEYPWAEEVVRQMRGQWGIPWMDDRPQKYHSRLLNAGWLVEDAEDEELKALQQQLRQNPNNTSIQEEITAIKTQYRKTIQQIIDAHYSGNNPASWYVLAAGDGDGMSNWLKGQKMREYGEYLAESLQVSEDLQASFDEFLKLKKRMGPSTHNALSRALLDFSNQLVPYLTERRYAGRLIYSGGDDVLAYSNLWEWDRWLWDIRQCFRGQPDPGGEFTDIGDYWQWQSTEVPKDSRKQELLAARPLFTMGEQATISFGVVIAHHSVPLAIALENLWEAEDAAKDHCSPNSDRKDAVQVRVLYANGNQLQATAKFAVFDLWQKLVEIPNLESALFEQAATVWSQHPAPIYAAIEPWVKGFCLRREGIQKDAAGAFAVGLQAFLERLWTTTESDKRDTATTAWLKMAAFVLRQRQVKLKENKQPAIAV